MDREEIGTPEKKNNNKQPVLEKTLWEEDMSKARRIKRKKRLKQTC